MLGRLLVAILATTTLGGCAQSQVSARPQPSSGPGWTLLGKTSPVEQKTSIAYEPIGDQAFELQITIFDAGGRGCGAPTFTGFRTEGTTLVAKFERAFEEGAPECLATHHVRFEILLDRKAIPDSVKALEMSEECEFTGCRGHSFPFP